VMHLSSFAKFALVICVNEGGELEHTRVSLVRIGRGLNQQTYARRVSCTANRRTGGENRCSSGDIDTSPAAHCSFVAG